MATHSSVLFFFLSLSDFFLFFFFCVCVYFFFFNFFKFSFIFKLYIIVLVLPNIKMYLPQVYMCSPLAWRIPGTGEPAALPSLGSHRVRHD